jgi:hypothetical protein
MAHIVIAPERKEKVYGRRRATGCITQQLRRQNVVSLCCKRCIYSISELVTTFVLCSFMYHGYKNITLQTRYIFCLQSVLYFENESAVIAINVNMNVGCHILDILSIKRR